MNRTALMMALLTGGIGPAVAQGMAPSGVVHGQNWQMPQDLDSAQNTSARPAGSASDRQQRALRQQRQNQTFSGVGRPVVGAPLATPPGSPQRAGIPQPTPPTRPAAPVSAMTPGIAARGAQDIPTEPGQSTGPARGGRPAMGQSSPQSTGAARATPASR